MKLLTQVRRGAYFDSVTLMRAGRALAGRAGVVDAAVMMGTRANRSILRGSGLLAPALERAGDADLLIAVKARSEAAGRAALAVLDMLLDGGGRGGGRNGAGNGGRDGAATAGGPSPQGLEGAVRELPGANLALISLPGRHAGAEAERALRRGLHVMLFSDNVALETEVRLKKLARARGLLLMGPDCGTALVHGAPLGFANAVRRGDVGIVAAAGTGLQEVACILHHEGGGVSQAIGTGGRDLRKEVGGLMFVEGLRALAADPATRVLLAVSKPPDAAVLPAVRRALAAVRKPVVALFLGQGVPRRDPRTLEEAALCALALSRGQEPRGVLARLAERDAGLAALAREAPRRRGARYLRGLFCGGTFCAEAQVILGGALRGLASNAPAPGVRRLADAWRSRGHAVVDLGADEFTVGRPHPMIDLSLRNRRILEEAADPATGVLLLDVVLGHGAHPDPAGEMKDAVARAARRVPVVCSVTGTDADPQNRSAVVRALSRAGAIVAPSNAAACRLAGGIAGEGRRP